MLCSFLQLPFQFCPKVDYTLASDDDAGNDDKRKVLATLLCLAIHFILMKLRQTSLEPRLSEDDIIIYILNNG